MSEWVVRHLPRMPKWRSERQLRKLSKRNLAERCWAAEANADGYEHAASERSARIAELADMLRGKREVDLAILDSIDAHRAHVETCRIGSCEHEYAALVRADALLNPPTREGER